jgi:putrescine aminotransferase
VSVQAFATYVNPPLAKFLALSGRAQRFVRAHGCLLETDEGEKYADWVAGFGALNLGHNPPALVAALKRHLDSAAPNLYMEALNPYAGRLAQRLVRAAGDSFGTAYFCNSGAEAVEAAIKLAMAATKRRGVVYCAGGYHGTTLGALSMMARGEYRAPFEPLLSGFREIAFNDLDALRAALEDRPAAFVVEPIQVESGLRAPDAGYLAAARELCDRHGVLLVLDAVQTGMGRTGRLFAYQHEDAAPHALVLAKSLGGGVMPLGAVVAEKGLFERAYGDPLRCEIHNATFGANTLACCAGHEALAMLEAPGFLEQVAARGRQLLALLHEKLAAHPLVASIECWGLLGGIRLNESAHPWFSWAHWDLEALSERPATGALVVHRMLRRKFLVQICGHDWSTLRVEPPLVVTERQCEEFVGALREELDWIHGHG